MAVQMLAENVLPTYDFAHISPAILELVTQFLNGYDILALCMTCSKPLFARIRAGGAKSFSIGPTDTNAWSAEGFGMLKYFPRLVSISIKQSSLQVWKYGPKIFEAFPPTVRSIALRFPMPLGDWLMIGANVTQSVDDSLAEFENSLLMTENISSASSGPVAPSVPKRALPKRYKRRKAPAAVVGEAPQQTVTAVLSQRIIPGSLLEKRLHLVPNFTMAHQFPSLEILDISGGVKYSNRHVGESKYGQEALGLAKCRFVASLPPSMQRVVLPEMGMFAWTVPPSLPPTLSELILRAEDAKAVDGAARFFPSQLVILELTTLHSTDYTHGRVFMDLPQSIERLTWFYSRTALPNPILNILDDLLLCTSLTFLDLDVDFGDNDYAPSWQLRDWFATMPRRLETLKVNGRPLVCGGSQWSSLPSSLTHLQMTAVSIDLPRGSQWPMPPGGVWSAMPTKVQDLHLAGYLVLGDADFLLLPRHLTRLRLDIHPISFPHPDCEQHHHYTICSHLRTRVGQRQIGMLFDSAVYNLPAHLTDLRIHSSMFGAEFWSSLPNGLTRLNLATTAFLKGDDLANLPPGLTHLCIYQAPNIRAETYCQLPRSLTILEIEEKAILFQFANLVIHCLPPKLTRLYLCPITMIEDTHIAQLPRGLTDLRIPQAIHLTARCASDLPRQLYIFDIKRIAMPTTGPAISRQELVKEMPHHIPIDDLPWVIGKSHRKLHLATYFAHQQGQESQVSEEPAPITEP